MFFFDINDRTEQIFNEFNRFIPRRIDLDRDYALDSLVSQNLQITSRVISSNNGQIVSIDQQQQQQQQIIRQQRRTQKRTNQQAQTASSRKTLELLEHFMPQNRRIYNFGVKTLKPRPIGIVTLFLHETSFIISRIRSQ